MKGWKKMTALLLSICTAVPFAACAQTPDSSAGNNNEPSDGKVQMDLTLMNEYAHENIFEITPTADGLMMEGIQNLKAACSKMRFPILPGEQLSCTFALPTFEEDSEDYLVTGVNMHTKTCVDIILIGQTTERPTAQLRLWAERSPDAVCVSSRITYRLNGESATYDTSFAEQAAEYPYADGKKVTGNMRASMPFTVVFDKEKLFQSYVDGDSETLVPLLDETKNADKEVIDGMKKLFADVDSVSVIFRFSGKTREDLVNEGMTGFEASSCFVLKEINGQSLCTEDGRIKDDCAPYIAPPEIVEGKSLAAYTDYTYEVKTNEASEAGRETVLYSSFATDVLSWKNLSYSLIITAPDGSVTTTEGLTYSIGAAGEYKIKALVRDESGNEYVSPERTFTAADTYRINVEGDIPATASRGSSYKLPSAYVTNADGERTDVNGNAYTYTVTVEDPLAMEIEIGADGTITFERNGIYIITYFSESADGTDKRVWRVTVS